MKKEVEKVVIELVWIEIPSSTRKDSHDLLVNPIVADYIESLEQTDTAKINAKYLSELSCLNTEINAKENKLNDIFNYIHKRLDFAKESSKKLDPIMVMPMEYYRGVIDTLEKLSELINPPPSGI